MSLQRRVGARSGRRTAGIRALATAAQAADVPTHVVAANINDAGIDPVARVQPRLARGRPGPAGREAARVHERRGRDQPARRTGARSAARADASATTRSFSPTATRRRSGAAAGRVRERASIRRTRRRTARSTRAWRSSTARASRPVVNVDRANSIENRLTKALEHLPTDLRQRGLGAVPRRRGRAEVVGDRGRRRVARRRAGRPDRDAAPGAPRRGVRRAGRTPSTAGSRSG